MLEIFAAGFLLSCSVCLDIGMVNVAIMQIGLQYGFKPAFYIGLGSCFGDLTYALLSAVLLSLMLNIPAVRLSLWIGGTVLLLYFAAQMIREGFKKDKTNYLATSYKTAASNAKNFMKGFGLALASPSAILWFASVGGSVIATYTDEQQALLPFFTGFFIAGVVWAFLMAFMSGHGRRMMGARAIQGLSFLSAFLFIYLAAKVFWDGYQTFFTNVDLSALLRDR